MPTGSCRCLALAARFGAGALRHIHIVAAVPPTWCSRVWAAIAFAGWCRCRWRQQYWTRFALLHFQQGDVKKAMERSPLKPIARLFFHSRFPNNRILNLDKCTFNACRPRWLR